jgi:prolipoprotein diacylglyceryltransferase
VTQAINAVLVLYALVFGGLGVEAFLSKNSLPSLLGGLAFAILMLVSLFVWTKNPRVGRIMSVVVALLGMGRFIGPFFKGVMFPAGVLVLVSLLTIGMLVGGHLMAMQEKKSADRQA